MIEHQHHMPKEMERTAPVSAPLKTKNGQKPPLHHKGGAIESVARNLDSDIEKLQLLGDTNRLDECTHRLAIDNDRDSSKLDTTSSLLNVPQPALAPVVSAVVNFTASATSSIKCDTNGKSTLSKHSCTKFLPKTQSLDIVEHRRNNLSDEFEKDVDSSAGESPVGKTFIPHPKTPDMKAMAKAPSLDSQHPNCAQSRPIYPNVPYSPYGSPFGSPRTGRRRPPLRESRRVSIDKTGSFLQLNQYKLMDQIGQGSYGLVKLAYNEEDSTHYAMKILSKRKLLRRAGLGLRGPKRGTAVASPLDRVYLEIAVLKKLDHPNVVKLVEVLDDPIEDSLYLVFELVANGEVLEIPTTTPLSEDRAWSVFRDTLLGVEYLHFQKIIHGDLKPANLLLGESDNVKVADLGVCNEFLGEDASMNNGSTAGTPAFRAPETLQTGQYAYNGKAADVWSMGTTLYALVFGNVPFLATSVPGVYEKIKNEELVFPATPEISESLRNLIENLLHKDPNQRLTMPQIKEHSWITKNDTFPLPTEEENCRLVQISDEDMESVVKSIPKLDTLILIKKMLKNHSFLHPRLKSKAANGTNEVGSSIGNTAGRPTCRISRLERFSRAGRSNSAPGDYHNRSDISRQHSNESLLPSLHEGVSTNNESEPPAD